MVVEMFVEIEVSPKIQATHTDDTRKQNTNVGHIAKEAILGVGVVLPLQGQRRNDTLSVCRMPIHAVHLVGSFENGGLWSSLARDFFRRGSSVMAI